MMIAALRVIHRPDTSFQTETRYLAEGNRSPALSQPCAGRWQVLTGEMLME